MSLVAVLFQVEPINLFAAVVVWCAVKESEVLSMKRSTVAESPALGAIEPHGRGADMQWAFPAGRLAVAVDRDMDVNLP